jgi:hypothetical protein
MNVTMNTTDSTLEEQQKLLQESNVRDKFLGYLYLGTLKTGINNTDWEELIDIGYSTESEELVAVVQIKKSDGYVRKSCKDGAYEYIRFFIEIEGEYKNVGYTAFKMKDPESHTDLPLNICAHLSLKGKSILSQMMGLDIVKVKAVLSYGRFPGENPDEIPVYGNVLLRNINLKKHSSKELSKWETFCNKIGSIENLIRNRDVSLQKKTLRIDSEFIEVNRKTGIPDSRTMYPLLHTAFHPDESNVDFKMDRFFLSDHKVDLAEIMTTTKEHKENTAFEELKSIGLSPCNNYLFAVVHIKKPMGYNISSNSIGSCEKVSFWLEGKAEDIFLGETSFYVKEIENMPENGLYYNVQLRLTDSQIRTMRYLMDTPTIKATLSWHAPFEKGSKGISAWGNSLSINVHMMPHEEFHTQDVYEPLRFESGHIATKNIEPQLITIPVNAISGQ